MNKGKMKIIEQQKVKYDYGVNTFIKLENNESYTISSMKMYDGLSTYNVYKGGNNFSELIYEDLSEGYGEILKMLREERNA